VKKTPTVPRFPGADDSPPRPPPPSAGSPSRSRSTGGSGATTSWVDGPRHHVAAHRVLKAAELKAIIRGLDEIGQEIERAVSWKPELEDVHMNIEAELTRRVPAGAKLHTGRSRNDQVALDIRLWLRQELVTIAGLHHRAATRPGEILVIATARCLIPGYTHLQRAQPVFLAHHLLAYVEMLERDYLRLRIVSGGSMSAPSAAARSPAPPCRSTANSWRASWDLSMPGAGRLTQNSMDAVSDRDFAVEFGAVAALRPCT
jgi:argininosuccinate lyase